MIPALAPAAATVVGALAVVLGLIFVGVRLLSRLTGRSPSGRQRPPMQVLQRVSLGPKQGLSLVRIGDQLYAVGTGEGVNVAPLALGEAERRQLLGEPAAPVRTAAAPAPIAAPVAATLTTPAPAARAATPARPTAPTPAPLVPEIPDFLVARPAPAPRPAPAMTITAATTTATRMPLVTASATSPAPRPALGPVKRELRDVLRTAMRTATTLSLAGVTLALAASHASAQAAATAPAAAAPRPQAAGTPATTAPTPATVPAKGTPPAATAPAPATTPAAISPQGKAAAPLSAMKTTEQVIGKLAPQVDVRMGGTPGANDGLRLSGTVGVVVMMGLLTLLPTLLLMMTGFTRILIVLQFLRQAMGTQSAPPSQLIAALALLLTGFVMAPTLQEANTTAVQPWLEGKMEQAEMMATAVKPFRAFMLRQTRDKDIETFLDLSEAKDVKTPEDIPLVVLASAFATSELRIAFQMGFAIFLPFIIVDMVVSSVLMSMGMYMLPPAMISLPFKLLLFVLVDGWTLVVQSLVHSFH